LQVAKSQNKFVASKVSFLYVMDGGNEQRFAKTFCLKAGLSATETLL
jgi:hypothetical protein